MNKLRVQSRLQELRVLGGKVKAKIEIHLEGKAVSEREAEYRATYLR